jgi:hypothetical protein
MVRSSEAKRVRLDSKNRIALGKFIPDGVTGFDVLAQDDGSLLLSPTVEIPAREAWLFKNKNALSSVRRGLKQAAEGKTAKGGVNFEKHLDPDD